MERLYFFFIILIIAHGLRAQNVGINTTTPLMPLHVASSNGNVAILENTTPLTLGVENNLYFADGLNGPNDTKYTGAIKSIGTGGDYARLGFFTYASPQPSYLLERMSITDNGAVGIGTTNPQYTLDVAGAARVQSSLQVTGGLTIGSTLNPATPLSIGNNAAIGGTLTVSSGKGIVRSVDATQMKIKRISVTLAGTNLAPGGTLTSSNLYFGEDYSSVTVNVGQVYNGSGDWAKVLLVPCNVDLAANSCQFTLTNTSSAPITFSCSWELALIGN